MAHLVYITTDQFGSVKEEPNPYNPILGKSLLSWLGGELRKSGWEVSEPEAEDWGWYVVAAKGGGSYMVGASGEPEDEKPPTEWIIQIHKNRSFMEKLTGKNKLSDDEALTREIESIARREARVTKVEADRNG